MLPSSRSLLGKDTSAVGATRRVLLSLARLGVGIGLLLYLAHSGIIDWRALSRLLTGWPITLAAVTLILLDIMLMALRLAWLFRPHGLRLRLGMSLQLTLVSFFFGTFLPGAAGGDLAKLFYVTRENSDRRTEVMTIVILDRVIGLFSLLVLSLLFAPMFRDVIRTVPTLRILLVIVALLAFVLLIAFLACLFNQTTVNRLAERIPGFLGLKKIAGRILAAIGTYRRRPGTLVAALGISLVANICVIAVTALAILEVTHAELAMKMCLIIPIGHIVNSLPLTPGGLGVGEAAFNALFRLTGVRGGAEALLCWRIWTALVGILGLVFYLRGLRRRVFDVGVGEERCKMEGALYDSVRTSER
jgi:glycosyltransferase 2 family protein